MAVGQHKLSRRAVLAGGCAAVVVPPSRHCERSEAIQAALAGDAVAGLQRRCAPRNDETWERAAAGYARAVLGLDRVAHSEDDDVYDAALGRHNRALSLLLRTRAPDLGAVAGKLDLIMRHSVFELSFGEAALEALRRDVRGFAGVG